MKVKETAEEVKPGDAVLVVDEKYREHIGLVTCVHGSFGDFVPCINVAYVTSEETKRDPYGQQIDRMSSLQHYSAGPNNMPKPGRFWANL